MNAAQKKSLQFIQAKINPPVPFEQHVLGKQNISSGTTPDKLSKNEKLKIAAEKDFLYHHFWITLMFFHGTFFQQ